MSVPKKNKETLDSLAPSEAIRVDNVFAKMPVHRIAKKGNVSIRIIERGAEADGKQIQLYWKVDPNEKVGEPGPLAYRVDTIIVNRCLYEAGRPLPRILRLGDLRPIAHELGLGGDTNAVKRALKQNAFAGITAKLAYRDSDGNEQWIDNYFTRYNVVFRGGVVDGRHAECAYLVLNDPFYSVLNNTNPRPLDYDFLKRLPPAAQRFYELISPRMYAMFTRGWHYAEMAYSDLCTYSTLTRHSKRQRIQSQLARIHRRHLAEEYISEVSYRSIPDAGGGLDLLLRYCPGRKAIAEYVAFNGEVKNGPYRTRQGAQVVGHLFGAKRLSGGPTARNSTRSESPGSPEWLTNRFQELRHGAEATRPTRRQVACAREIVDRCGGDQDLAAAAVEIAARTGRASGEPGGFPADLGGVLEGPFIDLARAKREEARRDQERATERERDCRLRAEYDVAMEKRAQGRVAGLGADEKQRLIEQRLASLLKAHRWYIETRGWDDERARQWASPRILKEYGREGEPSYEQWLSSRRANDQAAPSLSRPSV